MLLHRSAASQQPVRMTLRSVIIGLGGVARTHQLLESHSPGEIRWAVRRGEIRRLRKGVYAASGSSIAAEAAACGGRLTCVSLLRLHGVWVLSDDQRIHIDVGRNGRRHELDGTLTKAHNTPAATCLTPATVHDALRLAAQCLSSEAFFAAYESAWNQGLLSHVNREWLRRNVSPRMRWLLTWARGDAESGLESLVRLRLMLLGFRPRTQVLIPTVGRVDLVIDNVIIETDGERGHADPQSRAKDLVRDRAAAALGYRTIRLNYAMVVHDWPESERAILACLGRKFV
ncbi:DUF559 domain-containing protein [Microbacterium mitrae]|uniref:DUF559 domain-containing protein n=2 Tax=Microbacterium mitrae TaxID=664640 RepID=A0A5C8HR63_9MICO|nr:DUF559 domain-containing protein [Microbacterium mitrae]